MGLTTGEQTGPTLGQRWGVGRTTEEEVVVEVGGVTTRAKGQDLVCDAHARTGGAETEFYNTSPT